MKYRHFFLVGLSIFTLVSVWRAADMDREQTHRQILGRCGTTHAPSANTLMGSLCRRFGARSYLKVV